MGVEVWTPDFANPQGDSPPPTDPNSAVPAQPDPWFGFGSQDPVQDAQTAFPLHTTVYIPATLKMSTTPDDAGLVLPRGAVRAPASIDLTKLVMWIRRRGQSTWLVAYTAWQFSLETGLMFLFDSTFYALAYGRYEMQLNYGAAYTTLAAGPMGYTVGVLEVNYQPTKQTRSARPAPLKRNVPVYPAPPDGLSDMYQDVVNFAAPLTAVLEIGAQVLSFAFDDLTLLLGVTLPAPVQFQISDGARSEIVEYAGPSSDQVVVQRAVAGTCQARFPIGSIVSFVWTAQNTSNAAQGPAS